MPRDAADLRWRLVEATASPCHNLSFNVLPSLTPADVFGTSVREFRTEYVAPASARLTDVFKAAVVQQHACVHLLYSKDETFAQFVTSQRTGSKDEWQKASRACANRGLATAELMRFVSGLQTVLPNTARVEADFSSLKCVVQNGGAHLTHSSLQVLCVVRNVESCE